MCAALLVTLPIAVSLQQRRLTKWHVLFEVVTISLLAMGYFVMFSSKNEYGESHFWVLKRASWHALVGGAAVVVFTSLLASLLVVNNPFSNNNVRFGRLHKQTGVVVTLAAFYALWTGFQKMFEPDDYSKLALFAGEAENCVCAFSHSTNFLNSQPDFLPHCSSCFANCPDSERTSSTRSTTRLSQRLRRWECRNGAEFELATSKRL
jgi:hypothetical protein